MSQAGIINVIDNNPEIPIIFDADTGSATAIMNILNVFGAGGIVTSASGNTITIDGSGIISNLTLTGDTGGALTPTLNNFNIVGGSVVAGTTPVQVNGAVSTLTVNVQRSQAIASTDATKIGLAAFDSADFNVDANGFVTSTLTDLYVSPYIVDAAGGPGSSFTTIQAAVTQAIADGATSVARNILIRPGIYAETFSISTTNAKLNFIGIGVAIASSSQPLISGTLTINGNGTVIGFKDIFLSALTLTLASEIVVDRSQISAVNANLVSTFTGMDSTFTLFNHNYSSLTSTLSNCNIPTLNVTAGSSSVFGGTCATCNVSAGASASFFNCRGPNLGGSTGGTINLGGAVGSSNILSGSATLSQLESQQGNFILQRSISSSGNAANTDYLILVDSSGGAVTVTIPIGLKNKGRSLIIKDVGGAAASNNITITPTSATIDGVASKVISSAYGALTVFYNGTNYFTL